MTERDPHFPTIRSWRLPAEVFTASIAELAQDGARGNEGVALWLGRQKRGVAHITHVVLLRGSGVIRRPDQLSIDASVINDVTDVAIEYGLSIIGQIHSHGRDLTDLSRIDRLGGIAVPSYLSVVAPFYGMRPNLDLLDCGVHVCREDRTWRRLSKAEVHQSMVLVRDSAAPVLVVGETIDGAV